MPDPTRHRLWRLLRTLLPAWYREPYGDAMARTHAERAEARGRSATRMWAALTWDVVATAAATRLEGRNDDGRGAEAVPGSTRDDGRRWTMSLSAMAFDVRVMVRSLLRRPGYTLTAVATLGLGIGVAGSIYSVVRASLLRPLPYPEPDRVVQVRDFYQPTGGSGGMSVPNYLDLKERTRSTEGFAGYVATSLNLATDAAPERVTGFGVTPDFLPTLGVAPLLGRGFTTDEAHPDRNSVALITHRVWTERFGSDPGVLERTLRLNGEVHDVVGVLPPDFWFTGDPDVLVPLGWNADELPPRGSRQLEGVARLADGVGVDAAQEEMRAHFAAIAEAYPEGNQGWTIRVMPMSEYALSRNREAFQLLGGAALLVLLIGCVNVANLMLVRAERRQREIAVRAALGAGRRRLSRHFLGESVILTAAAWVVGTGVAWAGSRALVAVWGSGLPRSAEVAIDGPVLLFTAAVSLGVAILVGLVPTLRVDMRRIYGTLREGGLTGAGAGGAGRNAQRLLVAAEVALAVVLVAGSGLLLHSAWNASRIETGVDVDRAAVFQVQVPTAQYTEPADVTEYYRRAVAGIAALPGVQAVGITDRPPLQGGYNITTLASPVDPQLESSFVEIRRVTPGFFEAAGIPLLEGRLLTEADGATEAQVVVISDALAGDIFPDGDAVGQFIDPGWTEDGFQVVGVVGSVREWGVLRDARPAFYWPYPVPSPNPSMTFVLRTTDENPLTVIPAVRDVMRRIDATIPVHSVATLEDVAVRTLGQRRLATNLFATFGVLALLLSAIGIAGLLAYTVEQRTREIGIRIAIGAGQRRVVGEVVAQGMRLVALGLVAGVAAALLGARLLADLLYEVEPTDAVTMIAVVAVVVAASALASWLPARRAARVEPSVALRTE